MQDINEDLRQSISIDRLAERLGAERSEVEQATELALPALLEGMNANAHRSEADARSLLAALAEDHDGSVLEREDSFEAVDEDEGRKIVHHIFGNDADEVANRIGSRAAQPSLVQRLLPMLAPIVMGWLSRRMGQAVEGRDMRRGDLGGGGLGGVLGGLLGGAGAGGGMGDLLGGLLGGDGRERDPRAEGRPDMGGLLDVLGGLAGSAGTTSGARTRMPDLSDLFGGTRG